MFIVLLSFSEYLATKYLSLIYEPYIVRPTLIDLNPVELKCYPFMISLNKRSLSCNVLSQKICVPNETKDINVKVFSMKRNKNKAKTMANIFHVSENANSIVQYLI